MLDRCIHAIDDRHKIAEAPYAAQLQYQEVQPRRAWVRRHADRYLGLLNSAALSWEAPQPPVSVTALRAHLYAEPRVSAPNLCR